MDAHPLADLFPMMDDAEFEAFADDIAEKGQARPIVLYEGMILDGRNRAKACAKWGLVAVVEHYAGDDPLGFVLSQNLHRRHLTESQRALVAAGIVDWDNGLNQHTGGAANLPTREAGKRLSISERAVRAAKRIRERGADELVAAIRDGRVSVHAGEAISTLARDVQAEVIRQEEKAIVARAKAIRDKRRAESRQVRGEIINAIAERGQATAGEMPVAAFPILYADPPWQQEAWSDETGQDRGLMYPAMVLDEIKQLCAGERSPATPDAALFLWVTANRLDDGIDVLRAWGFDYVTCQVWDKVDIGMGRWVRDRHEILLIGKRGNFPAPLPGTQAASLHAERKAKHSAKPAFFAEMIERLYPDMRKLELFCRSPRPGWHAWGFEADPAETDGPEACLPEASNAGARRRAKATAESHARPSVTAEELAKFKALSALDAGLPCSGSMIVALVEAGLAWDRREDGGYLTDAGKALLADLDAAVTAASDGDAVHVREPEAGKTPKPKRGRAGDKAVAP